MALLTNQATNDIRFKKIVEAVLEEVAKNKKNWIRKWSIRILYKTYPDAELGTD